MCTGRGDKIIHCTDPNCPGNNPTREDSVWDLITPETLITGTVSEENLTSWEKHAAAVKAKSASGLLTWEQHAAAVKKHNEN